jgi:hypothetical protein
LEFLAKHVRDRSAVSIQVGALIDINVHQIEFVSQTHLASALLTERFLKRLALATA